MDFKELGQSTLEAIGEKTGYNVNKTLHNLSIGEKNEFAQLSQIFQNIVEDPMAGYSDPVYSFFARAKDEFFAIGNLLTTAIKDAKEYDGSAYIPTELGEEETFTASYTTDKRVYWDTIIPRTIVASAFVNPTEFGKYVALVIGRIKQSREVWTNKIYTAKIVDSIKKVVDLTTVVKQDILSKPAIQWSRMFQVAGELNAYTDKYNANAPVSGPMLTHSEISDLCIIINPVDKVIYSTQIQSYLFHNDEFNTGKFVGKLIVSPAVQKGTIVLADRRAFYLQPRIEEFATQSYILNMKTQWVMHMWVKWGLIGFFPAVKFILSEPTFFETALESLNNGTDKATLIAYNDGALKYATLSTILKTGTNKLYVYDGTKWDQTLVSTLDTAGLGALQISFNTGKSGFWSSTALNGKPAYVTGSTFGYTLPVAPTTNKK